MKMSSKSIITIVTLFVATLCLAHAASDNVFPPKKQFILPNIIQIKNTLRLPIVPIGIRPILPNQQSTATPMTTPSMVDFQTWNFTNPSDIAKDCFSAIGTPMVKVCQDKAARDWDASKLNTSTSTTWETCCSLFEELDCYVKNANNFCPDQTKDSVAKYAKKVAYYFHWAICQSISFSDWQNSCDNATHASKAQNHSKELDNNPDAKPQFVNLPQDDGPEKACFIKLRTRTKVNFEQKCQDQSLNKWDPTRRKFMESGILESCCSIYDTLDCIQKESANVCNGTELTDMDNYRKKSMVAFSQVICKTVPYDQAGKLCGGNGSYAVLPSIVTLFSAIIVFIRVNY